MRGCLRRVEIGDRSPRLCPMFCPHVLNVQVLLQVVGLGSDQKGEDRRKAADGSSGQCQQQLLFSSAFASSPASPLDFAVTSIGDSEDGVW